MNQPKIDDDIEKIEHAINKIAFKKAPKELLINIDHKPTTHILRKL